MISESYNCRCLIIAGAIVALNGPGAQSANAQQRVTMATRSVATVQQQKKSLKGLLKRPITVDIKGATLSDALLVVARSAKIRMLYQVELVKADRPITLKVANIALGDVLDSLLLRTRLRAVVVDAGTINIVPAAGDTLQSSAQSGQITGRVVDSANGKAIPGVTVTIQGTTLSVLTNSDGEFTFLKVSTGRQSLSFKLLGYQSSTRTVSVEEKKRVSLHVILRPAASVLSGVITTVTGQQRKLEIGNDITTLDVPEIMKQAPITSVTDLLEARVPGLTVMRTSGVPGAPSRIRLRGMGGGMLANVPGAPTNDPIVIVDGIRVYAGQSGVEDQKLGGGKYPTPSPIDQIDPNSIEKIEVLRGPSASAMYGADAGNGVIVITTKKGKAGTMRWDVTGSGGIESMPGVYAAPGFYRFGHDPTVSQDEKFCPPITQSELYFRCKVDSVIRFQALNEPRLSTIGRGTSTRLSGTASGGVQDLMYSVTGSITNTLGLTKMPPLYQDLFRELYDSAPSRRMRRPNSQDTKSGQASFSGNLTSGLTATFSTSLSQSVQYQSSANDQLAALASTYLDTLNLSPGRPGQYAYQLRTDAVTANHALALNLSRWDWLPLTTTFGMNRVERSAEGLTPRGIVVVQEFAASGEILTALSKGKFTERRENITTTTARINGTLFPRARVSLSLGSEITKGSNAAMEGSSDTLSQGVSRPSTLIAGSRTRRSTTTGGWFLEPRLNLNSRFFVNPGFRIDGSGASGSRGGFNGGLLSLFPKLNFSWIAIDREGGEPLWGVVSLVRPRLALGVAGVQPAAEWSLRTFKQNVGPWLPIYGGIAPDLGLQLRAVGNTQLSPEKTQEIEGGVDLQLWNTRLTVSVTGFYKMRKDAIQQLPLAPSIGAMSGGTTLSYYANIGHVRNTGGEFTLNAVVLDLPNVGWTIDVSVSKYTNTLTKLFGDQPFIDLGDGTRLVQGYPLFGRWSRPISGWSTPQNGSKLWYGDFVVADSAVYMGAQAPNFEMPFRTSLTFFRGLLSVNGQFNYKAGLTQYNLGSATLLNNIYENPNSTYGQQAYALAAACYTVTGIPGGGKPCTDYGFIQKVNSLRFNSLSVGYNVPRMYLKRLPFSSLSVSLQGSNLGLWTNYRGKDPDVNGTLIGDATSDSGQLPMPRIWSLQIRIGA